jgi:hypothetical protein
MSQTYAKVINQNNITASIIASNNISFIQFNFEVYENLNLVDETYDSRNYYSFITPLTKFTWNNTNEADSGLYIQVNLQFGNTLVSFNRGEYADTNGDIFDPNTIYGIINSALSYTP